MFNNTMSLTNGSFSLCSLDGVTRNHSSVFYAVTISTSVIIAILSPVAVVGNALVMAAIWRNPSLRTPSYILLCGLAFTDLCTGLITQPFYVAAELICLENPQEIEKQLSFLVSALGIAAGGGTYFTSLTLLLITLISIERWLHMTRRSLLTVRRSYFIVVVGSLVPIPIALFHLLKVLKKTYQLVSNATLFVLFLVCIIITSIAYFKVFRIIRCHQRQVQTNETSHAVVCQQVQASEQSQNFGQPAINLAKYKKSVISMMYILGIMYMSFLPFLLFVGLSFWFSHSQLELLYIVAVMFLFLTSSLNPVIYLWRMNDIRKGVKQLLKQLLCQSS